MSQKLTNQEKSLTQQEKDVINHAADGLDNNGISRIMELHLNTVNAALKRAHVIDALHTEAARRIQTGGVLAIGVGRQIMLDETVPAKTRLDASKWIASLAGYVPPKDGNGPEKPLSEASSDELNRLSKQITEEQNRRINTAKPIELTRKQNELYE